MLHLTMQPDSTESFSIRLTTQPRPKLLVIDDQNELRNLKFILISSFVTSEELSNFFFRATKRQSP